MKWPWLGHESEARFEMGRGESRGRALWKWWYRRSGRPDGPCLSEVRIQQNRKQKQKQNKTEVRERLSHGCCPTWRPTEITRSVTTAIKRCFLETWFSRMGSVWKVKGKRALSKGEVEGRHRGDTGHKAWGWGGQPSRGVKEEVETTFLRRVFCRLQSANPPWAHAHSPGSLCRVDNTFLFCRGENQHRLPWELQEKGHRAAGLVFVLLLVADLSPALKAFCCYFTRGEQCSLLHGRHCGSFLPYFFLFRLALKKHYQHICLWLSPLPGSLKTMGLTPQLWGKRGRKETWTRSSLCVRTTLDTCV